MKLLQRLLGLFKWKQELIPAPFRTHGCATFWVNHGCPNKVGDEIQVAMTSGKTALFRLTKREHATGVDWCWYDFDFVRYLPATNREGKR